MTRDEDGFTLPELLVAIALLGIVVAALMSAVIVGLKTTTGTTDRLAASTDAQFTSTWFVTDVQAAEAINSGDPCALPSGSSSALVTLKSTTSAGTVLVGYAVVPATSGEGRGLVRYKCVNGVRDAEHYVARHLDTANPTVVCTPSPCATTSKRVAITVTALDALDATYTYTLEGQRRVSL